MGCRLLEREREREREPVSIASDPMPLEKKKVCELFLAHQIKRRMGALWTQNLLKSCHNDHLYIYLSVSNVLLLDLKSTFSVVALVNDHPLEFTPEHTKIYGIVGHRAKRFEFSLLRSMMGPSPGPLPTLGSLGSMWSCDVSQLWLTWRAWAQLSGLN